MSESQALTRHSESVLSVIARAASDPSVDVAKMESLIRMQIQVMAMDAKSQYDAAMSRLQPRLPVIERDKKGANGKYASIENIDERINPLLMEEGFHFTFTSVPQDDGKMLIHSKLHHKGGHHEESTLALALDRSGSKANNETQAGVSTVSYGKRVLKCMMLDLRILGADKDGDTTKTVTAEQALDLKSMIDEIPEPKPGYRNKCRILLLAAMGGVATLEDIPAARFSEAVNKLKAAQNGPTK